MSSMLSPHASPWATAPAIQLGIKVLRHQRWTCAQIAGAVDVSAATAARILRRAGLSRRGRLAPPPLAHRYEHAHPEDLLHIGAKRLGRIAGVGHRITGRAGNVYRHHGIGWECLHVAVDDHSRAAYVELLADERGLTVAGFLCRAVVSCPWRLCPTHPDRQWLGLPVPQLSRHLSRTARRASSHPSYTPRTNRKGERFIQTALREWAYVRPYYSSVARQDSPAGWSITIARDHMAA